MPTVTVPVLLLILMTPGAALTLGTGAAMLLLSLAGHRPAPGGFRAVSIMVFASSLLSLTILLVAVFTYLPASTP